MKIAARKDLAFFLVAVGVGLCVLADFFAGTASWWLIGSLLVSGIGLVILAGVVLPPFWWGVRTFTTPLKDPTRESRQRDESQ